MGFKFKKRISFLGGLINFNFSKNGVSTSYKVGPMTVNPKRNKITTNAPIKGIYHESKIVDKRIGTKSSGGMKRVSIEISESDLILLKNLTGIGTNKGSVQEFLDRCIRKYKK